MYIQPKGMPQKTSQPPLVTGNHRHMIIPQLVEHVIRNDGVRCSNHLSGTKPTKSVKILPLWRNMAQWQAGF